MIKLQKDDAGIYRQRISVDAHDIFADVDANAGGENSAPDPHDLLGIIEKCPIHKLLSHATINITTHHQW